MPTSILPATWQLPEGIRNRLGNKVGRQRAMFHDGHLLLVLHAPPKADDNERQARLIYRNPRGEWTSKDLGNGIRALAKHIDEYEEVIARLDRQEEQATTADQYFLILESLAPIHRSARHLHEVLQDARKKSPDDQDIINMRDRAYAIERSAELLYGETKNSLDFRVVRRAEEQARSTQHMAVAAHRLNMLVAFFFPIATLTAIFGINLEHGYEHEYTPYLFLGTIAVGLLLGAILAAFVQRRHDKR